MYMHMLTYLGHIKHKARQHSNTNRDGPLSLKSELPQVGFEPTSLYSLDQCSVH